MKITWRTIQLMQNLGKQLNLGGMAKDILNKRQQKLSQKQFQDWKEQLAFKLPKYKAAIQKATSLPQIDRVLRTYSININDTYKKEHPRLWADLRKQKLKATQDKRKRWLNLKDKYTKSLNILAASSISPNLIDRSQKEFNKLTPIIQANLLKAKDDWGKYVSLSKQLGRGYAPFGKKHEKKYETKNKEINDIFEKAEK